MGKVLVAGASGVVGHAAAGRFATAGYEVIGLSRHTPVNPVPGARYVALDLLDREATVAAARDQFAGVSHIVYGAVNETPGGLIAGWTDTDHAARNGAMFENLLAGFEAAGRPLEHVSIVHGTKAYGFMHYDRLPAPLRESDPRPPFENFYFRQEDAAKAFAERTGTPWTVMRAQMIAGGGVGGQLNSLLSLAVHASLLRLRGEALQLPNTALSGRLMEMTDAELLGDALVWAARSPNARDRIFNVTNGDIFTWRDSFPVIAEHFGLEMGEPADISIAAEIEKRARDWARVVAEQGLAAPADWKAFIGEGAVLADFTLGGTRTVITSTIAIRQAGFAVWLDSADCIRKWFSRWQDEKLLPRLSEE